MSDTETNVALKKIDDLLDAATQCIDDPNKSISQIMGINKKPDGKWEFNGMGGMKYNYPEGMDPIVYEDMLNKAAEALIVASGGIACAAGVGITSFILGATGIGLPAAFALGAAKTFIDTRKERKQAKLEKERLYRTVIQKQQAAISKLYTITETLEAKLSNADSQNEKNRISINSLKSQVKNMKEVIDLLSSQSEQFRMSAQ